MDLASPGPFTTQPIIETVIGVRMSSNCSSISLTVLITSNCCLAQDGQDITVTPFFLILKTLKYQNLL